MLVNFKDLKDTFVERLKNPFAGTFIIVMLFHHWILIYSLLHFDSSNTLAQRIEYVKNYIDSHDIYFHLVFPALWAIVVIIAYQLLTYVSKAIDLAYKAWVYPFMFKVIDKSNIVTKDEYNKKRKQLLATQISLSVSEDNVSKINGEMQLMKEDYGKFQMQLEQRLSENLNLKDQLKELELNSIQPKEIDNLKNELAESRRKTDIELLFAGAWRLHFNHPVVGMGDEDAVFENNEYLADGKRKFRIDMVEILGVNIKFRKSGIESGDDRVLISELKISNNKLYEGTEKDMNIPGQIIYVEYRKVASFKKSTMDALKANNKEVSH